MTIQNLIDILSKFDPSAAVIIRDLNGLDWTAESFNFIIEDHAVIIDTQDINVID